MSKQLIIAEKPSVANDLQRTLAKKPGISSFDNKKDYFENSQYIISSAIGHLVAQKLPTAPNGKALAWKFDVLPIIPEQFELEVNKGAKMRFNLLKKLMSRKDVDTIINACDAGREGELIFRYIIKFAKIDKPIKRLWLQSMTQGAILRAFDALRSNEEMQPLSHAAFCRSESDWLIGINSTRAMTAFNSKYGGFQKTPVGRVQTPTLAILAEREIKIQEFKPKDYWEVHAEFTTKNGKGGIYPGVWFDEKWEKDPKNEHDREQRIWQKNQAEEVEKRCKGKIGIAEEETKPQKQAPYLLYDLTSVQRDAAVKHGFSARFTLSTAQALYERHKAITYPRTDSRCLPEDYLPSLKKTFQKLTKAHESAVSNVNPFTLRALENNWIKFNKKYFNDAKISDHFAIVPTGQVPKSLQDNEYKIFQLIYKRTIAAFFPHAEWLITKRITRINKDAFRTNGKVLEKPGWLEIYKATSESSNSSEAEGLEPIENGEKVLTTSIETLAKETKPPARYTEATLLSAMENAGKFVQDQDLKQAMSERGLGTPATRATIIEGLINDKYISRNGKEFFVSNRGVHLINQLRKMRIDILASPEMTGEWEYKLKKIESGKYTRQNFMQEIKELTGEIVTTAKSYAQDALSKTYPEFNAECPQCHAKVIGQDEGMYKCKNPECNFKIPKIIASRPMSETEIRKLLKEGKLPKMDGFLSRFRQPFSAELELTEEKGKLKLNFIFAKTEDQLAEIDAIKPENILCKCPLCDEGEIYITPTSYICNVRVKEGNQKCKARLSRNMCKYEITPEEAKKFFTDGSTGIITKFISKKGRPFSAAITLNKRGNRIMNWEFQKKTGTKKAPAKST